jgi:ribulose-phosphate 3-epimerase
MPVLESINKHAKKIDVHLMIVDPDRYIKTFADLGANILSTMKPARIFTGRYRL